MKTIHSKISLFNLVVLIHAQEIKREIMSKETLYSSFNSSEILDVFLNYTHQTSTNKDVGNDQYSVFLTKDITKRDNSPGLLRTKPNSKGRQNKTQNKYQPKNQNRSQTQKSNPDRKKTFDKKPWEKKVQNVGNKRISTEDRLKTLGEKFRNQCFKCLDIEKPHIAPNCETYPNIKLSDTLHYKTHQGKEIPCGYHAASDCKAKQSIKPAFWGIKNKK